MRKYWVNFAATGNPNGVELEDWPQYRSSTDCFLEINAIPNGNQIGLRTAESDLWDDISGFTACSGTVNSQGATKMKILQVYPNPSPGIFFFNLPGNTDFEVSVYNSSGQKTEVPVYSNQIDLKSQSKGIYFIEVKTKSEVYTGKIVKTN